MKKQVAILMMTFLVGLCCHVTKAIPDGGLLKVPKIEVSKSIEMTEQSVEVVNADVYFYSLANSNLWSEDPVKLLSLADSKRIDIKLDERLSTCLSYRTERMRLCNSYPIILSNWRTRIYSEKTCNLCSIPVDYRIRQC